MAGSQQFRCELQSTAPVRRRELLMLTGEEHRTHVEQVSAYVNNTAISAMPYWSGHKFWGLLRRAVGYVPVVKKNVILEHRTVVVLSQKGYLNMVRNLSVS